ncbi:enoyl-CoA hydratase/isomerase family protein [Aneurinibacillus tyrosinisolvens]|uniref:enoyl-CoA hydratase/isomerase family protein n=1 Tax=Aneurinibacillus tyrosinisolvens TaxID=1443435 RepID=UPI00069A4A61|nr:enoyl-CoA hydratase/isomerase family protein [Aneurinibacillus tyrosinisolvens]
MNLNVTIHNGIANVILDYPPLNILSEKVKEEITQTFQNLAEDRTVRVILFHSGGDHFCCGANLKEFPDRIRNKTAREVWVRGHAMLASIINLPQPTIAYVTGNALGGGAELASAFDIRVFASTARVGYPEVLRGVFPGNGGLERLISLVGEGHAMRLVLTGKPITAEEAYKIGLASEVVSEREGKEYTEELARYVPPCRVRLYKPLNRQSACIQIILLLLMKKERNSSIRFMKPMMYRRLFKLL